MTMELCVTPAEHTKVVSILGNARLTPDEVRSKMNEILGDGIFDKVLELKQKQGTTAIKVLPQVRQRFQPIPATALRIDGQRHYE